ncbi:MAG: Ig-like domain repeat protein, partial [Actinobacteria bacterium]|nr:Ig-like domain repeat protein [Actinomycetota bacterium]
ILGAVLPLALTAGMFAAAPGHAAPLPHAEGDASANTAASAGAQPVFDKLELRHSGWPLWGGNCELGPETGSMPAPVQLTENTGLQSQLSSVRTLARYADPTDLLELRADQSGTATGSAVAGRPQSVRLDYQGTTSVHAAEPSGSGCSAGPQAGMTLEFAFSLAEPMLATLSYSKTGTGYTEASLHESGPDSLPYETLYGQWFEGSASSTVLLPAGSYGGQVYALSSAPMSSTDASSTVRGTVEIRFAPANATRIELSLSPKAPKYNGAATATVSVRSSATGAAAAGRVTVSVDGRRYEAALKNGTAAIPLSRAVHAGSRVVRASYASSDPQRFSDSTGSMRFTVTKVEPKVAVRLSKKRIAAGSRSTAAVRVSLPGVLGATATGKVAVYDGKKRIGSAVLKRGKVAIKLPKLRPGSHRIVAKIGATSDQAAASSMSVRIRVG